MEGRKDGREEILHRSSLPNTCPGRPGGVSAGAVWGRVASLRVSVSWQNWDLTAPTGPGNREDTMGWPGGSAQPRAGHTASLPYTPAALPL